MMNFLNIFGRKKPAPTESEQRWQKGYEAFQEGQKHFAGRRDHAAVDSFDDAAACGIEQADLFSCRGSCLQSLEWHLDAIDDFTKAISLEPENCNFYFQRAMSKIACGDQQGFLVDIKEAIRLSKVDSSLNRVYNEGAKEMGWDSVASMYAGQIQLNDETPDFILKKKFEHTKLRGRRSAAVS